MDGKPKDKKELQEQLGQLDGFTHFSDMELKEMLAQARVDTWKKGAQSFQGDKTLHRFYIVLSGRVKMYQIDAKTGKEYTLFINSPGDFFDIICLLDGQRHEIEIEALDPITLLSTPMADAREWIKKHPNFNRLLLPYIAKKMRTLEEKANDLALFDTWARTLKLFVKHAGANAHDSELKLINNLSHSEIAKIIGTSKNVINRHIQKLKEDHILHVSHKHISIKDMQGLLSRFRHR